MATCMNLPIYNLMAQENERGCYLFEAVAKAQSRLPPASPPQSILLPLFSNKVSESKVSMDLASSGMR
ncbi:hypothetical protein Lal_00048680 [Lupinus albus]|nr:hypothetical protein Lal_00048680 [Lupinus albus]